MTETTGMTETIGAAGTTGITETTGMTETTPGTIVMARLEVTSITPLLIAAVGAGMIEMIAATVMLEAANTTPLTAAAAAVAKISPTVRNPSPPS